MHFRPSSLPALSQCPKFESGSSEFCEPGTDRHSALAGLLTGETSSFDLLTEDEQAAVTWAADYVRLKADSSQPILTEHKLSFVSQDFSEWYRGTIDVACGGDIFDLKSRYRDYTAQMAAYALMWMLETNLLTVRIHILFGESQRVERYELDWDSALAIVTKIVDNADRPDAEPTPCEYCSWCAKKLTCKAFTDRATAVNAGRDDWALQNYHASEITDENEMGKALTLARLLKKWAAAVEFHALQMVQRDGKQIAGYALASRKGKTWVSDVPGAYSALAASVDQEAFFSACDLRFSTSKKYPDKKGIVNIYAEKNGMKNAAAKRTVEEKLAAVLVRAPNSVSLKATNETEETEE